MGRPADESQHDTVDAEPVNTENLPY